jgi:hypothetical protein
LEIYVRQVPSHSARPIKSLISTAVQYLTGTTEAQHFV